MATTRPWLAQGLQVLVVGLVVVDSMAVTLLLPRVAADFDSSRDAAIWVVNLYQMVGLGLLLPLAALGQQIGFKRIYLRRQTHLARLRRPGWHEDRYG